MSEAVLVSGLALSASTAIIVSADHEGVILDVRLGDGGAEDIGVVRLVFLEDAALSVATLLVQAAETLVKRLDTSRAAAEFLESMGRGEHGEASPQTGT